MSTPQAVAPGRMPRGHPAVRARRTSRAAALSMWGLMAFAIAFAVCVAMPKPNFALAFAIVAGVLAVVALASITRLEVTVTLLALYLGVMDGPVKLLSGSQTASSGRDILIAAVSAGALLRLLAKRERITLPPLTIWVVAFAGLVIVQAFNPKTAGIVKVAGGFRQNLEWVPFFFFGYVLIRSKASFRKMFVILGVLALVNGIVSTYQTKIGATALAGWGPGYSEKVNGNLEKGVSARRYISGGQALVRPPALGGDSGFGGAVGIVALAGTLALLATGGKRRRWYAIILCLGSLVAVVIGLSRLELVGAVIGLVAFLLLSLSAGKHAARVLRPLLVIVAIALPLGAIYVTAVGTNVFSRYESVEPNNVVQTSTSYKERALTLIPHYLAEDPFGFGLATGGPAAGFGGSSAGVLEGHGVTAETQYNLIVDELGGPGLLLWIALSIEIAILVVRFLPKIRDIDIRICLAAVFSVFVAHTLTGLRGPYMTSGASGAFFWFSLGIAAYWLAGPGRKRWQASAGGSAVAKASTA